MDDEKRETLGFLIADAETILDIRDEGPLIDDFFSLKKYYTLLEEKILKSQGNPVDLSGGEIIPSKSFFIVERGTIYPFSIDDIKILLREGKNPYTSTEIDKEKIKRIQAVLEIKSNKNLIGGMLEVFDTLDENNVPEVKKIQELQRKIDIILESKTFSEFCEKLQTLKEEEVQYTASAMLWALYEACNYNIYPADYDAVQFLADRYSLKFSLNKALEEDNPFVFEFLMQKEPNLSSDIYKKIIFNNSVKVMDFILKSGYNIDKDQIICYVSVQSSFEILKLLVENGADVNARHGEPLQNASANGYINNVKLLIEYGASEEGINKAFIEACRNNHIKIAELLLDQIDPGQINTALIVATENGHYDIVKFLLEIGADVHMENDKALFLASFMKYPQIVNLLLENGASFENIPQDRIKHITK